MHKGDQRSGEEESVDYYYLWLGIPPDQQPPTDYSLLGLQDGESDREVIWDGFSRQHKFAQRYLKGEQKKTAKRLLTELEQAQDRLLQLSQSHPKKTRPRDLKNEKKTPHVKAETLKANQWSQMFGKKHLSILAGILLLSCFVFWSTRPSSPEVEPTQKPAPPPPVPVFATYNQQTVEAGSVFRFAPYVTAPAGARESLRFAIVGVIPEGMTVENRTGLIEWTPPASMTGRRQEVSLRVDQTETGAMGSLELHLVISEKMRQKDNDIEQASIVDNSSESPGPSEKLLQNESLKETSDTIAELKVPGKPIPFQNYGLESNGWLRIVVPDLLFDGSHPITLECWAFLKYQHKITGILGNLRDGISLGSLWDDRVQALVQSQRDAYSVADVPWYRLCHLAAVFDGVQITLFVDGRRADGKDAKLKSPYVPTDQPFIIGGIHRVSEKDYRGVVGLLDEVRISDIARYTGSFIPTRKFEPDPNTLALYHCDEGEGELVHDSSQNLRHAKLVGGKWIAFEQSSDLLKNVPYSDEEPKSVALTNDLSDETQWVLGRKNESNHSFAKKGKRAVLRGEEDGDLYLSKSLPENYILDYLDVSISAREPRNGKWGFAGFHIPFGQLGKEFSNNTLASWGLGALEKATPGDEFVLQFKLLDSRSCQDYQFYQVLIDGRDLGSCRASRPADHISLAARNTTTTFEVREISARHLGTLPQVFELEEAKEWLLDDASENFGEEGQLAEEARPANDEDHEKRIVPSDSIIRINIDRDLEFVDEDQPLGLSGKVGRVSVGPSNTPLEALASGPNLRSKTNKYEYGCFLLGNSNDDRISYIVENLATPHPSSGYYDNPPNFRPAMHVDSDNDEEFEDEQRVKTTGANRLNGTVKVVVPVQSASGIVNRQCRLRFWIKKSDGLLYYKPISHYRGTVVLDGVEIQVIAYEIDDYDAVYDKGSIWFDLDQNGRLDKDRERFDDGSEIDFRGKTYRLSLAHP